MKTYSREQRAEAKKKLPKPVGDFLDSDALIDIYLGLIKKHRLNIRQAGVVSEISNITLLDLEPQSALETNLHQALPELSASMMRELVDDINDRIFKEARRRLQENITEPEKEWDEEELGPKSEAESIQIPSDEELEALAEKEEKEGWKPPEEEEVVETPVSISTPNAQPTFTPVGQPSAPIALQKLAAPVVTKAEEVQVKPAGSPIQSVERGAQNAQPVQKAYPASNDPYREPVE